MQTLTLREALKNMACLMVAGLMPGINDTHIRYRIPDRLLDLRIIGDAAVATDLEAGAKMLYEDMHAGGPPPWSELSEEARDGWVRWAGHVLTACMPGIIVPDVVHVFGEIGCSYIELSNPWMDAPLEAREGDTLTLTHKYKEAADADAD